MPGIISQVYPYFESGFPLRAADLNNFVKYAEGEDRQTRIWLTGSGCIYGLNIHLQTGSNGKFKLVLSKGVGITSQGYLVVNNEEDIELGTAIQLNNEENPTNLTTADFMGSSANVVFGKNEAVGQDSNILLLPDAKELSRGGDGIDLTDAEYNKEYSIVLLVYLAGNRTIAGCQNCEKSILATVDIRALLLSKEDLKNIDKVLGIDTNNPEDNKCKLGVIDSGISDYPYIDRFNVNNIANSTAFWEEYRRVIRSGLDRIVLIIGALGVSDSTIKKFFGNDILTNIPENLKSKLLDGDLAFFLQYVYAFIRDIINTYQELVETRFGEIINYLPPGNCFPRHLILGSIKKEDNKAVTVSQKRTPFFRPPFTGFEDIELEKAKSLYNRLRMLLEKSLFVDKDGTVIVDRIPVEIRITPSAYIAASLGEQAIPYYYEVNDNLRSTWNFQLYRTRRSKSVHSYIRADITSPFNEPLKYQSAFDRADFYRIEGLAGMGLDKLGAVALDTDGDLVDSTLHSLRKSLNLPFAIKLCTLEPATLNGRPVPLFSTFINQHPGLEHQGGVPKGGTFVLVIDGDAGKTIIGDFCLPYYVCCKKEAVIAEFMVESPNNFVQSYDEANNIVVYEFPVRYPGDQGQLHIFFKNLSQNAESYMWKVGDPPVETPDADLAYDQEFLIIGDSAEYDVTLTARRDNQDVASVTKKIILQRETEVSVIAEFIVESPNDFEQGQGHTSDDQGNSIDVETYTFPVEAPAEEDVTLQVYFKNISQHADRYFWTVWKEGAVSGNRVEDFDLALDSPFVLEGAQTAYLVCLTASREDAPEVSVVKKIVLLRVVEEELPVIAEFIVESPNDFEQGRGQISDDQGNSIDVEMYTFPFEVPAEGDFKLQVHFKNISQHADRYFWTVWKEGAVPGNRVEDFDLALDRPFVLEGAQTAYLVRLTALREDASEVSVVKKIVLRRVVEEQPPVADFGFLSAESKKVESVDTSDPAKVIIRLKQTISPLQNLVVNWVNKSPKNTESYLWKALQKGVKNPFDISTAKKNFKSTLPVNLAQMSEFTIILRATNTATGLSNDKSIIVEVHPSG